MKTLFKRVGSTIMPALVLLSLLQTANAQGICGVSNPVTDLPWLANLISQGCNEPCTGTVFQATYNGQTVFYNTPSPTCADAMEAVYDCSGNMICWFGGLTGGGGSCPNFFETVIVQQQLCSAAGGCNPPEPTVVLPTNRICLAGFVPPPTITATVTPVALPLIYALGLFVVDEAGNIVLPITSGSLTLDLAGLPAGGYTIIAIVYAVSDPPNLLATTLNTLETSGGCYKLSSVTPANTLNLGDQIPHASVTTAPNCNPDGSYTIGVTMTGSSSGSATWGITGIVLQEGIQSFATFNQPYYDLHVSDALTGCAEDFIELFGPVDCSTCFDSTHYNPGMACIEIYDPVCGCDSQTYTNWCYAYNNGLTSWTQGACSNQYYYTYNVCSGDNIDIGMEGWEGNVMYEWTSASDIVGCAGSCGGNCSNCYNITVSPTSTTTYVLHTFSTMSMEHSYYNYTITVADCAVGCIDTTLINPNAGCPDIWIPVCGCNFMTYGNECDAVNFGGVTSFYLGQCGEQQSLTLCAGDSIQIGIPWIFETFYEWTPTEDLTCLDGGCNYAWVKPDTTTRYVLRAYSPMPGSFGTVYFFDVNVEICNSINSPENVATQLHLYPNPTNDEQLTVEYSGHDALLQLSVYNTLGQQVMAIHKPEFVNGKYLVRLPNLPKGVYYVALQTVQGNMQVKPLVNR